MPEHPVRRGDLLRVRDATIARIKTSRDRMLRESIRHFLSLVGHGGRIPASVLTRRRRQVLRSRHSVRRWRSPVPIETGLGLLLLGFIPDIVVRVRRRVYVERYWLTVEAAITGDFLRRRDLRFVLLLWDWLKVTPPWLRLMVERKSLSIQCGHRLYYWPFWKDAMICLRRVAPDLDRHYHEMAESLDGFWFYRRQQ